MTVRFKSGFWVVCALVSLAGSKATAQQYPYEMVTVTDYLLYFPQEYEADTTVRWPLVVCLHGGAESKAQSGRGVDAARGIGYAGYIEKEKHQYPFIVLSPQADNGWDKHVLARLIEKVKKEHRVDEDRVYLTGLSMGGGGTWETAQAYPDLFAAIAPVCGYSMDTTRLWTLAHMPIWVHHGDQDDVLPIKHAEKMVNAIRKYNPDNIKFSIWEGHGHHIYFPIYGDDQLWKWFLTHTRVKEVHKEIELTDPSVLQTYIGKYQNDDSQNIEIRLSEQGELEANWFGKLYPKCDNTFFIDPSYVAYVEFQPNADNGVMEIFLHFTHDTYVMQKTN